MRYVISSTSGYRTDFGRQHEFLFFCIWAAALFLKFYFMEFEVLGRFFRPPLALAASALICIVFVTLLSLLPRRLRFVVAILLSAAFSVLALTDLLHMRFYSDLFSFHNLGLSSQVEEVSDSVLALLSPRDALYFCDIPLLAVYFCVVSMAQGRFFSTLTLRRAFCSLFLLIISISLFFFLLRIYNSRVPNALNSMWDRPAVCSNVGALTYHFADARNVIRDRFLRPPLSEEEKELAAEEFARFRSTLAPAYPDTFGAARGKNLIIIQAESLQSFVLGLRVNGREVTPNVNRFAAAASFSGDLYVQTGAGNSSDAELLANAGLYPARSGVAFVRFANRNYDALPRLLRGKGYRTIAMHGDRPGFWNRARMYPKLGFEQYISKRDYVVDESLGLGLSDGSFFRQSLEILKKEKRPFYAFLVTLSSHYPFGFPKLLELADFDPGEEAQGKVLHNYLAAIHYFDREFGKFIDGLKRSGLYDDSLIILYGDHAAIPKWDSAALAKLLKKDLKSEHSWRAENKVPFIVHLSGVEKLPATEGRAFGQIDIPTSAAALLGLDFSSGLGRNIFAQEPTSSPVIFRNGGFISGAALVSPSAAEAADIKTGESLSTEKFSKMSEECAKTLELSDKILEYGLRFPVVQK